MLPKELSNGICSLNEGQDRLTLSVIMEIDNKGNIVSSEVVKGVINVTKRMSYTGVQKVLDEQPEEDYKPYLEQIKLMEELAHILEDKRKTQGYLDLDIPESKITLDKNGYAIDVGKYETTFANEIIEQFMLTANEAIAEKFYWLEAPFIYRVHETPDQEKISELNKFLLNFGYKIKGSKDNIHPKAFSSILDDVKGKDEEKLVSNLILRTLKVARYEAQNKGHFGIAGKYYCHFTSPI
jgi:ribonuclease R